LTFDIIKRKKKTHYGICCGWNKQHWQVGRLDDLMKGYLPFLICMIPYNREKNKKRGIMKTVSGY